MKVIRRVVRRRKEDERQQHRINQKPILFFFLALSLCFEVNENKCTQQNNDNLRLSLFTPFIPSSLRLCIHVLISYESIFH